VAFLIICLSAPNNNAFICAWSASIARIILLSWHEGALMKMHSGWIAGAITKVFVSGRCHLWSPPHSAPTVGEMWWERKQSRPFLFQTRCSGNKARGQAFGWNKPRRIHTAVRVLAVSEQIVGHFSPKASPTRTFPLATTTLLKPLKNMLPLS